MSIPGQEAVLRFQENEVRFDDFLNAPSTYLNKYNVPVETLTSLVNTVAGMTLTSVFLGNWVTSNTYNRNEVVKFTDGVNYICKVAHNSGIFATDLAANKWVIYQPVLSSDIEILNVKLKGALGDDTTDNTTALQNALNSKRHIYIPPSSGNYITKKLTAAFDGQMIFGGGVSSCLQLKAGETGELFNSNGKRVLLKDMKFFGGSLSGQSATSVTEPTGGSSLDRSGVYLDFDLDCIMENVAVIGFGHRGIHPINISANRNAGTVISNCKVSLCWVGLNAGLSNAEYLRVSNSDFGGCQYGVISASGNQTFIGGIISDNYVNILVLGTGVSNNSHSSLIGALLNHATTYNIKTDGVTNGFTFVGCSIFAGSVYLKNSTGVIISNGLFDINNFLFEGGGRNYVRNNYCNGSFANTVAHNYNASTSNTLVEGNSIAGGMFSSNTVSRVAFPYNPGAGDFPMLLMGTPGLPDSYGVIWTGNVSTGYIRLMTFLNSVQGTVPILDIDRDAGMIRGMMLSLSNYANDGAAATGGIPVGGMYRNGSILMVRVS